MKLAAYLKTAHAIEVGAYQAYEGHWRNLPPASGDRIMVLWIQQDELDHKQQIERMMDEIGSKRSVLQDAILWTIGRVISIGCYVMGYRAAMWGAGIMEKMGQICYREVAEVARSEGYPAMATYLDEMQKTEEEHEQFFKKCLENRK